MIPMVLFCFHIYSGEQETEVAAFFVYMLSLGIPWTYLELLSGLYFLHQHCLDVNRLFECLA